MRLRSLRKLEEIEITRENKALTLEASQLRDLIDSPTGRVYTYNQSNPTYIGDLEKIPDEEKHLISKTNGCLANARVKYRADIRDVMAVEGTSQFHGLYHVLGGLISPMDGIGPSDLTVQSLVERCERDQVSEIIFAFNATMEGETTAFYISKKLQALPIEITSIARGIAVGAELEYTDEITLGRSLQQRVPYGKANH
jgi:hypothetical protein